MNDLSYLSPVIQFFMFIGSCVGVYVTLNNKIIKAEYKMFELEQRFNRKDSYDEKLKTKVDQIGDTVTEVYTILKQQNRA